MSVGCPGTFSSSLLYHPCLHTCLSTILSPLLVVLFFSMSNWLLCSCFSIFDWSAAGMMIVWHHFYLKAIPPLNMSFHPAGVTMMHGHLYIFCVICGGILVMLLMESVFIFMPASVRFVLTASLLHNTQDLVWILNLIPIDGILVGCTEISGIGLLHFYKHCD